jgi:hypothetical protein
MSSAQNLHKMLEKTSKNLANLRSKCALLNECDATNCSDSEEENAYRREFEDISARNLARIELGIAEAQVEFIFIFGHFYLFLRNLAN